MTTAKPRGTALAPLVYWLLVVSGLAGITVLRFGSYGNLVTSDDVFALWAGSVLGIGLGQLASFARIRAWVPAVVAMFGFWFVLPILFLVVEGIFGATAQTFLLAFMPAIVCGYLSLAERGALLSFWYPSVLWMIVILDGPVPGVFDEKFALPFVVGLAALFVVYLRARETRRVAIWTAHSNERLAETMSRTVLRSSPLRAASQHVWSAMVGAATLVLTAWIAPHLWETVKDPWRSPSAHATAHGTHDPHAPYAPSAMQPCCPAYGEKRRERVKEYFPLQHGHDMDDGDSELSSTCRVCASEGAVVSATSSGGSWSYGGTPGSGLLGKVSDVPYSSYGYGYTSAPWMPDTTTTTPSPVTTTTIATTPTTSPWEPTPLVDPPATPIPTPITHAAPAHAPVAAPPAAITPDAKPASDAKTTSTHAPANGGAATEAKSPFTPPPPPAAAGLSLPAPWKSSLGLCTFAFGLILLSRATRRALTLRHLARPFWNEPIDQRISNHWQRMLIGLRDAGLAPSSDEQPQAFARRVGIAGMETCATILERVRHGVRVDMDDLVTMAEAADDVFRTARGRAGFAARATAWLRAPLA